MSDNQFDQWGSKSGNKSIDDPHKRLIDKLQKLLQMSQRAATEAESATAAAKLQHFLTEHNLSMADLEKRGAAAPAVGEAGYDLGKAAFKWKLNLAEGIAEFYYCAPIVDHNKKTVKFVGRPDNIETLTALYKWVIDQIKAIATSERRVHYDTTGEHIDPLRWQLGFGEGAADRLIERLREMKTRQEEDMSRDGFGDVSALVIHHMSEASDYLEEKYGYRADGKPTKRERERQERWRKEREEQGSLKVNCEAAGDMEPYYKAYPWERPDTPEEIARREKANKEFEKREARNAKRRTGGGGFRSSKSIDWDKEAQLGSARKSGKEAAGKVNLQPFITGTTDRKRVN